MAPKYPPGASTAERVAKFMAALCWIEQKRSKIAKVFDDSPVARLLLHGAKSKFAFLQNEMAQQGELEMIVNEIFVDIANLSESGITRVGDLMKNLGRGAATEAFSTTKATDFLKKCLQTAAPFLTNGTALAFKSAEACSFARIGKALGIGYRRTACHILRAS